MKRILAFLFCILLMPLNWSIEAMKWKYINDSNKQFITFKKSIASVIFGACAGFISPGRWGEPFARAYYLGPKDQGVKVYSNLVGIISQWIIVLIAGMIAVWYNNMLPREISTLLLLIMGIFSIAFYLVHDKILDKLFSFSFISKMIKYQPLNLKISNEKKVVILLFGILRFTIFSIQYLILIKAFSFNDSVLNILMKIFLLFLFQSFSMFPSILDLGYKGNIALFLFKNHPIAPSELLFIIFFIWLVNLAIPSIFGYFIFTSKIRNLKKSED